MNMDGHQQRKESGETGGVDIARVLGVLYKRKWLVAIVFLVVVTSVVLYTKRQTPVYSSTATLIIERTPPRVLTHTQEVVEMGNSNYWSNKEYYQTQYSILKSRQISLRVVDRLGLEHDIRFNSRKSGSTTALEPSSESAPTRLELAEILSKRITVRPVPDSMLVELTIEDSDPDLATELANTFAEVFREYNLDRKQTAVSAADHELEELVKERRAHKEKAELSIIEFDQELHVGTIDNEKQVISQAITTGEIERERIQREIDTVSAKLAAVKKYKKKKDIFSVGLNEVIGNPFVMKLKSEYVKTEGELIRLEISYLDQHPKVQGLRQRLVTLEKNGRREIDNIFKAVRADLKQLHSRRAELAKRLVKARDADAGLANRKVEYDRRVALRDQARQAYNEVYKRLTDTKMSAQIHLNNVAILDVARRPEHPIRPNLRANVVIGILLGVLGGIGFAFFVEFMDNTVKGREDLEQRVGLTFLGLVPTLRLGRRETRGTKKYDGPKELLIYHRPMSTIAEFSRAIRTNLMFISPDRPLRSLVVTSPNPREGKTTIAINIGINIAASGNRVVLVDTDMRRPRLHTTFGARTTHGVSSYLIGDAPVGEFIQTTEVPNMDILPCGSLPPNPAELVHTDRFNALLEELGENYDTVIFDSPPVNLVTDSLIIGNHVDGVVLVAKWGKTTYQGLNHARRQLETVNARILGCVLNDLDLESRSYGYYYGTGHYGYGYGEEPEKAESPA